MYEYVLAKSNQNSSRLEGCILIDRFYVLVRDRNLMEADHVSFGILEACNTANRSVDWFANLNPLAAKVGDRFGDIVDFEVDPGCAAGGSSDPFERRNAKIPLANFRLSVFLRPVLNVWRVEAQPELLFVPAPQSGDVLSGILRGRDFLYHKLLSFSVPKRGTFFEECMDGQSELVPADRSPSCYVYTSISMERLALTAMAR